MILAILDKIVSNAMKVSRAKNLTIEKYDIINKPLNKKFNKSNRDNSFSTTVTCHDILISSKKKMICSNISKGSNDPIILTTEGWEENDVIRNKEKQSTICNVEHNKKCPWSICTRMTVKQIQTQHLLRQISKLLIKVVIIKVFV